MKPKFAFVQVRASRRQLVRSLLFTSTIVVAFSPTPGKAEDKYWDRTAGTNIWATNTNWSTDATLNLDPAAAPGINDLAIFNRSDIVTAQTIELNAAQSALGLRSDSSGTVTLLGNGANRVLTLDASGILKTGTGAFTIGSGTANINVSLALSADQTWANNNNTGAITIVNGVAASTAVDRILTLGGSSTAANTISGIIANNGVGVLTLNKSDAGTWVLSGANTYTGVTTISGGILTVQNNAALGTNAGGTVIQSGGTLNLGGTLAAGLNIGTEAITVIGAGAGGIGAITNIGSNDHQNAIQGVVTMVGDTTFGGSKRWDIRNGTLNGGGAGYVLTKVGTNSVFLSGTSQIGTSLGQVVVREGEFVLESGAKALTGNITGGVLIAPTSAVTGSFRSWSNFVDQTANFTLDSSFAGSTARLSVDNGYTTHSGTITAIGSENRLDVNANAVMIDTGVLAGTGAFRKEGGGVLLVNGTSNTHSGAFNLNAGFLGGTGTLTSSSLNINNGGTLSPGLMNQAGTFNVTNAIVSSGVNAALFNLGTTSDLVNVGSLTQDGTTNIGIIPGSGFAPGTYTLYDYGTLNGTTGFAGFKLNHVDATLIDTGSEIKLQVNSTAIPTWSGVSNGIWTAGSLTNPILPNFAFAPAPGGQVEFVTNDAVLFDDTAVGTTNITLVGTIAPAVTRFNNAAKAYTLNGAISGAGQIIKDGSGTVTLLSTPTTLGGLDINSGTLQLGNDSFTVGYTAGPIDIATGATLAVMAGNGGATATLGTAGGGGTPITGGGTILLNSTVQDIYHNFSADRGNVTISGDMTGFTGNIVINDGNRLTANTVNSLGNAAGITINDGGAILVNAAGLNYAGPISIAGLGWEETGGSAGAIRMNNGATLSGSINLTGDTRITAWNGSTGTLSGPISGVGKNLEYGFRQISGNSSGTITVSNTTSTYSGSTSLIRTTINATSIADTGVASSLGSGSVINMEVGNLVITGSGSMTTNRTINLNQGGQGGSTIGVSTPGAVVTFTGAINNGNANFPISTLDFRQTLSADGTTGGTIILDTATPIRTSGTNIHRTNLTLAGNTSFTVDFPTTGTTAAPLGLPGDFKVGFNTTAANSGPITLTVQDNATLTTYGRFDVANENPGFVVTTTVNQTGGVVNAMRGGASMYAATGNESNNAMRIGHWTGSMGIYNLSGGTLNVPNGYVNLSHDGNGTLNQTSGTTANIRGLRFGNSNTVTGIYNLDGGTLNIGDLGIVRGGTSTTHQINLNGGTLRATADFAIGSNLPINVQSGGATINTNGFNINSASALLAGTTAGGVITKTGLGEFNVPSGLNTMDGTININGGSFGGAGEFTAATINVNNGGTLAGTVNVSNTTSGAGVLVASGGTISPGNNGGADNGTLNASSATFTAGSKLQVSGAFGDSLAVTGAVTGNTVISVVPNGLLFGGPIPLVSYGSNSLVFTTSLPHLVGATVTDNLSGSIDLNFTSQETLTWTGTGGAVWDASTANTWNASTSGAVNYLQGDVVEFKDSSAVGSITVQAAGVTPADVLFDNSVTAYTLTGGGIGGGGALVKSGTATVILATNNSYSGATTINAGTLQIGNGGTSGTLGLGATTNNGTLSFNRSDSSLYLGTISGTGIVRSDGTGTTTLGGANTYSGGTIISKGILVGRTATSFGSGTITINDASTGSANTGFSINSFNVDPAVTVANNIVVNNFGTGTVSIGSSEQSNRLQGLIFTGTLTLGRDVTIYGEVDRTSFSGTSATQTTPVITGFADKITIARSPNLDAGVVGRVTWDQNNSIAPLSTAPGAVTTIEIQDGANLQMGVNAASSGAKNQIPDTATVNVMAGGTFSFATTGDGEVIGNLTGAGTVRSVLNSGMLLTFGTATDATFSGVINGGNSLSFRKVGTGTATWSGILDNPTGNIDVAGGTMVFAKESTPTVHAIGGNSVINSGGTLKLAGSYTNTRPEDDGRLGTNTAPYNFTSNYVDQIYNNVQLTINAGGILDMNGKSEMIDGFVGSGTGKVTNSVADTTSILYVGQNNASTSFTGILEDGAGVLSFVKTGGTGVQTLGGNNTYTGVTEVRAGAITMTHVNALGSSAPASGTVLKGNRDAQYATLNITLAASTPAAPNIVAEHFAMYSETESDQRTQIANTTESTRLTGNIVVEGDGINQITANQAAGDQLQINGNITGSATGNLGLRGNGELQLNGVINAPDLQLWKTDPGLLILNSTGNNYGEATFVHGTVRTDVANALDPTAVLRMGQTGNANTLELNGNSQTVAGVRINNGVTDAFARTINNAGAAADFTINTPAADGGDYNYAGLITGAINLTKAGPGSQVLSGSNTYSGITNVTGGSLYVNGTHSGGGDYTVGSGAILGGEGTINTLGNVTFAAGSNLRVGNTTDAGGGDDLSFSVTDFTLSSSTTLSLDLWANLHLAGQTAGADQGESDVLEVYASTINLAGILNVANPANISSWMVGDTFDLFDWFTTPTGTFNTVNLPTLTAGLAWDTSKLYLSEGTDGDLAGTIKVASSGGLTPIETWRQTHFGSPANTGNGADGADPDKDGVPNVMEYALGMIPTTPTTVGLPTYTTVGGSGKISFNRSLTATDVTYVVQASNNLTAWTDLATRTSGSGTWSPVAGGVLVTDPGSGAVSVTDNVTVAGQSKRFMRLVAINPLP